MTFTHTIACTAALALGSASAAWAQDAPPRPIDHQQLRHQVYVMEGALTRAVEFGAQSLNREVRAVMPDSFMLAGQARARGVYLDGYGIFFDVEVPIMRQSMVWNLRSMLDRDVAGVQKALTDLRQSARSNEDPAARQQMEKAISRIELQLAPFGMPDLASNPFAVAAMQQGQPPAVVAGDVGASTVSAGTRVQSGAPVDEPPAQEQAPMVLPLDKPWMKDLNRAYTDSVQRALIDAMIDYSAPIQIGPEEWLTVAARDNYQRDSLAPPDPLDDVETILLRIKGTDLMAYRAGRIDKDEARRRVTVSSF
jgi:hypothetical protein